MVKGGEQSLTDDQIKDEILLYLYRRWKKSKGIDSAKAKVSEIQKAMKSIGIRREEANRNLSYLVDTGWVKEEVKESHFTKGKFSFTRPSGRTFRISPSGIERFQGKSIFQKTGTIAGINIQNVSGVVNIGDDNYIRNESVNLFRMLDELDSKIRLTDQLTDEEKLSYRAEVKTIQSQLPKQKPDKNTLKRAWEKLKENLPTVASLVSLVEQIKPLIESLI